MSKIICDLCGTVYPDTEECCPTCGTDKPVTAQYMSEPDGAYAPHREYKIGRASCRERVFRPV